MQTQRLELSLVPSEKSNSAEHMIHPNIPFLTIRETKKRGTKFNTDLTTPKAWKVTLIIQNGVVYYLDHDLKTKKRVDVLHNGNQIKLGIVFQHIVLYLRVVAHTHTHKQFLVPKAAIFKAI